MKKNKLAQTATEYLVILAVVIVIALIIVSIMGGIPGIGKNGQDKAEQVFWKTADIAISSYSNTNSSGMDIRMTNGLREGIWIDSFALNGVNILSGTPKYIDVGQTVQLPLTGAPSCRAGESFSYNVEINYTTQSYHSYTFSGFGHKISGTCGN